MSAPHPHREYTSPNSQDVGLTKAVLERRMSLHTQRTAAIFAVLMVSLLIGFVVAFRTTSRIAEDEQWIGHTYQVLSQLDSLEISLRRADRAAQEYLRSGNNAFLQTYRQFSNNATAQVRSLQQLTNDNQSQQASLDNLDTSISNWHAALEAAVSAPLNGSARMIDVPNPQLQTATDILRRMRDLESELLKQRSTAAAHSLQLIRSGLIAFMISNFCFLVIAAFLVVRGERSHARDLENRSRMAAIVDSSDDAIVSKTLDGILTSWNRGAERLYEYKAEEVVGKHINVIIPPERQHEMPEIFDTLRKGERVDHMETERVRRDGTRIHVELTVSPIHDERGRIIGASAIARDITERRQMEESLRSLSARILQAEDEERRRIARDLHDTTVQELALLSINIAQLKGVSDPAKLNQMLTHAHELTNKCVQELRTLSYVLHPPMLDELGLASALKIYAEGFSQRSGVVLDIDVNPGWQRLSPETEIALFRVAQESLSNVVRHSGSPRATIKLERNGEIKMAIIDEGRGVATATGKVILGVGFLGMRERIKQLGGTLTIDSGPAGTAVEARLPLNRRMDVQNSNPDRG